MSLISVERNTGDTILVGLACLWQALYSRSWRLRYLYTTAEKSLPQRSWLELSNQSNNFLLISTLDNPGVCTAEEPPDRKLRESCSHSQVIALHHAGQRLLDR